MKNVEKLVLAINNENDIEAKKLLEKVLKDKVADKISRTLGKK